MHAKERVVLPEHSRELVNVIAKINQALFVAKARKDDEINHLVAQLTASEKVTKAQDDTTKEVVVN